MGFSMLGALGSHVFVGNSKRKNVVKFQYLSDIGRNTIGFNFNLSGFGRLPVRAILSKFESYEFEERTSPAEVKKEIERCYELIRRLGRGVVYLGSSRRGTGHSHYSQALELGREIANLLDCTSWTGAGPGLMDAATKGALQAGKPVGGFKIGREAGEWTTSNFHPYLLIEVYLTCKFFSARKHGLVDAVVRSGSSDRTAVVALAGGVGTLDEMFKILALIQLNRIGTELPAPFLLMNYDSYYSKLLEFLDDVRSGEQPSRGRLNLYGRFVITTLRL